MFASIGPICIWIIECVATLKSGIVVLVGIIVLVGTFARINKRTGGNKRTGKHYYQSSWIKKAVLIAPCPHCSIFYQHFYL